MADKKKLSTEISVKGVAAYCWLNKKDTRFSKNDDDAYYKVTLVVPKEDLKHEIARLERGTVKIDGEAWLAHLEKLAAEGGKNSPIEDGDEKRYSKKHKEKPGALIEEFSGCWLINFKGKRQPKFADSRGGKLPEGVFPFFGDTIRVAYRPNVYDGLGGGLSLWPNEVRIIEKNSGSADFGDDDHEGGYVADPADAVRGSESKADDNNGDF